jgi:putative membrane protein
VSAVSLLVVAYVVPGFVVTGFWPALKAAAAIGLINMTLGAFLKFITWPGRILTLGCLSLVINAFMVMLAAWLVQGFAVSGFWAAFFGSIVLSLVSMALGWLVPEEGKNGKRL